MNRLAFSMALNTHIALVLFAFATSPIDWLVAASFLLQSPLHGLARRRAARNAAKQTATIHDLSAHRPDRKAG